MFFSLVHALLPGCQFEAQCAFGNPCAYHGIGETGFMARLMELDCENTAWLKMIARRVGWPAQSLVGEDAAHAAWLLAQHADLNPAFQR